MVHLNYVKMPNLLQLKMSAHYVDLQKVSKCVKYSLGSKTGVLLSKQGFGMGSGHFPWHLAKSKTETLLWYGVQEIQL